MSDLSRRTDWPEIAREMRHLSFSKLASKYNLTPDALSAAWRREHAARDAGSQPWSMPSRNASWADALPPEAGDPLPPEAGEEITVDLPPSAQAHEVTALPATARPKAVAAKSPKPQVAYFVQGERGEGVVIASDAGEAIACGALALGTLGKVERLGNVVATAKDLVET